MSSHYKIYAGFLIVVTGLCVVASYQVPGVAERLGVPQAFVGLVSAVLGGSASAWIMNQMSKCKIFRRLILRNIWLEGWWVLLTYPADGTSEHKGLLEIRYLEDLKPQALAYYSDDALDHLTATSHYLTVDSSSMRYINFARVIDTMPNYDIIAVGELHFDARTKYPTLYKGSRVDLGNNMLHWQAMSKIDDAIIQKYQREHGGVWKEKLFEGREIVPFIGRASRMRREHFT
jgi:hypothetical protein